MAREIPLHTADAGGTCPLPPKFSLTPPSPFSLFPCCFSRAFPIESTLAHAHATVRTRTDTHTRTPRTHAHTRTHTPSYAHMHPTTHSVTHSYAPQIPSIVGAARALRPQAFPPQPARGHQRRNVRSVASVGMRACMHVCVQCVYIAKKGTVLWGCL